MRAVLLGEEAVAEPLAEVERLAVDVVEADDLVLPVRRGAGAEVDHDVEDRTPAGRTRTCPGTAAAWAKWMPRRVPLADDADVGLRDGERVADRCR